MLNRHFVKCRLHTSEGDAVLEGGAIASDRKERSRQDRVPPQTADNRTALPEGKQEPPAENQTVARSALRQ